MQYLFVGFYGVSVAIIVLAMVAGAIYSAILAIDPSVPHPWERALTLASPLLMIFPIWIILRSPNLISKCWAVVIIGWALIAMTVLADFSMSWEIAILAFILSSLAGTLAALLMWGLLAELARRPWNRVWMPATGYAVGIPAYLLSAERLLGVDIGAGAGILIAVLPAAVLGLRGRYKEIVNALP